MDLLKGIAVGAGMKIYQVPGVTGSIDTNWEGKAQAAIDALLKDGCDFVYIHVEAPDEMAHQGLPFEKVKAIEYLDSRVSGPVKQAMERSGEDFRILLLPDHPNLLRLRTHTGDAVPYVIYDSTRQRRTCRRYSEAEARENRHLRAPGLPADGALFYKNNPTSEKFRTGGRENGKSV